MIKMLFRAWPVAVVAALLGLAALAAANSGPQLTRLAPEPVQSVQAPDQLDREQDLGPDLPEDGGKSPSVPAWLVQAAGVVCLLAGVGVVGTAVWYAIRGQLRRRPPPEYEEAPAQAPAEAARRVMAAVDAGLAQLSDVDQDPRRAVIACWVRLEEAAAGAGTPRQIGDTSTDLVLRLLAGHAVSAEVLAGFAAVYREARYATTHTVDEGMREQARAALRRLRAELTAEALR